MKASEQIRKRLQLLTELEESLSDVPDSVSELEHAIEICEEQEKAEAWTQFSERMPPPPQEDDWRILLVRERLLRGEVWMFFPGTFVIGGPFGYERRWIKNPRFSIEEFDRLNVLEWLIIEPFQKGSQ